MKTHSKRGLRPTYLPKHGTDLKVVPCSWLPSFSANAKECPASGPHQLPVEQANLHAKDKQMNWCFLCFLLFLRQGLTVLALPGLKARLPLSVSQVRCVPSQPDCVCVCVHLYECICVWLCISECVWVNECMWYMCVCKYVFVSVKMWYVYIYVGM